MPLTHQKNHTHTVGFTIVELLIVVVVIAILAAITIVAYNGIQRRASDSAAMNAAAQAKKKISVWQIDNPNQAPDQATFNSLIGSGGSTFEYTPGSGGAYCVTSTSGTISYKVTNDTNPQNGGCQGHAQGGVAAITNYHVNPGAITSTGYGNWFGDAGSATTAGPVAAGWSQSGSAYRIAWTAVVGTNGDIQVAVNAGSVLTAGTIYTVRYTMVAGQNSTMSAPAMYASAGSVTTIARSHSSDITLTSGVPVTFWVTFQADSTALVSGVRALHQPRAKAVGYNYSLSETVTYLGAYNSAIGFYWGNSTDWMWNGTVNNSPSKGPPL